MKNTDAPIKMGRDAPLWRRAAQRFFANRWLLRRIVADDGVFEAYLTPGSQLSALRPFGLKIDDAHRRFIARFVTRQSIVWDVGANAGLFAFPAALKAKKGHVFCFEPDVELARISQRNRCIGA